MSRWPRRVQTHEVRAFSQSSLGNHVRSKRNPGLTFQPRNFEYYPACTLIRRRSFAKFVCYPACILTRRRSFAKLLVSLLPYTFNSIRDSNVQLTSLSSETRGAFLFSQPRSEPPSRSKTLFEPRNFVCYPICIIVGGRKFAKLLVRLLSRIFKQHWGRKCPAHLLRGVHKHEVQAFLTIQTGEQPSRSKTYF